MCVQYAASNGHFNEQNATNSAFEATRVVFGTRSSRRSKCSDECQKHESIGIKAEKLAYTSFIYTQT